MLEALAYSHLGDRSESDLHLREAERLCPSQCDLAGEVDRIAGAIEVERDDLVRAEDYFLESLQFARQHTDRFLELSDLLNLGVVAIGNEHFDQSIDWSSEALQVSRALQADLTEEKALGNLGWAYYKMGDFARSADFFQEAARRAHDLGAVIDQVEWLNNQGLVCFQTNQVASAQQYYEKSLDLARKSQNREQTITALTALAFASVKVGRFSDAKDASQEALRLAREENDRTGELSALLVQAQIAANSRDSRQAESLFLAVAKDPKSDTSLRWEAEDDLAKLYEARNRRTSADKEFRQSLATLERARSSLHKEEFKLPFLANATHLYDDYIDFLVGQGRTKEALQVADYSRAQTLAEGLGLLKGNNSDQPQLINPEDVARTAGGTLLFYWLGAKHSYLWAVTPHEVHLFPLAPEPEIDAVVERFRRALLGPWDPLQTANVDGRELYQMLVAPAKSLIKPHSRVFIIPDGSLNHLNFETLMVPSPKLHYWIEDVTLADSSSLRLLESARDESPKAKNARLLLIGNPVAPNSAYPELANAGLEIQNVEKHFPPGERQVVAGAQATPAAYLQADLHGDSYIHFVAHGTASELSPLDSAIVLSKGSAEEDSFKLYARDIVRHPLHAELVTISACYGQGVRAYTGEGLVGLSWAFVRAGAHNVIGALWEVSDVSTPELMDRLYEELSQGKPPDEALRSAKLSLLNSGGVFRKPFYWAPFQLYVGR